MRQTIRSPFGTLRNFGTPRAPKRALAMAACTLGLALGLVSAAGVAGAQAADPPAPAASFQTAALGQAMSLPRGFAQQLERAGFVQAVTEATADDPVLAAFYRAREFVPLWTGPQDAGRRQAYVSALSRARDWGLPPARYDLPGLVAAFHAVQSERERGLLEVRVTRSFLTYAAHLHGGVLDPARIDGNIKRTRPRIDTEAVLARLEQEDPGAILRSLQPTSPEFSRLLRARILLERQIAQGGWGPQVEAESLRPGDSGAEVVALRNRLIAKGYLERMATRRYDAAIQVAVQRFQRDHALEADGIAGPATLRALNAGAEDRLRSVLVALERERWMNIARGERHIWVNLADFTSRIIDRGQITFETISIVGQRDARMQTPEFSERMTYMEINPDWTVPRSITGRNYLTGLQRNPNAFSQFQIITSRGQVIDRASVDFSAYSINSFPFKLRQPPGPSNPLGKVKFMFPNPYAIYLHDTPDRNLFSTRLRAHSNGCIRLNDPEEFAHILLAPQTDDPEGLFSRIHRSGQQTRVNLDVPVPVHLVYRTAFSDLGGRMQYREDIYGRDARIFEALERAGVEMPGLSS
ncbi:L,D-transpeptidase family protein [Alkalilacustris brevis]|uniref:L,D-transpeptidase family protein n=1 Tax=Alkalilacustris brevis TaxID=2026338 RepID=UPI001EE46291|nr:L,D-transpeptidase family protein [Alkalilacustris brevis]